MPDRVVVFINKIKSKIDCVALVYNLRSKMVYYVFAKAYKMLQSPFNSKVNKQIQNEILNSK